MIYIYSALRNKTYWLEIKFFDNRLFLYAYERPIIKILVFWSVFKEGGSLGLVPSGTSVKIGTIQRRLAWPLREG